MSHNMQMKSSIKIHRSLVQRAVVLQLRKPWLEPKQMAGCKGTYVTWPLAVNPGSWTVCTKMIEGTYIYTMSIYESDCGYDNWWCQERFCLIWIVHIHYTMILCPQICVNWLCWTIYAYMIWIFAYICIFCIIAECLAIWSSIKNTFGIPGLKPYKLFFFFFRVGPFQRVHSQHVQTSGCPLVGQNSFIVIQIIHWWEILIIISSCHDVVRSSMMNDK